ncbi:MAG: hypothetical protein HY247_05665 [archaeon]|nr:MAG: hypothetical protein HY247_05665 [archaeon]
MRGLLIIAGVALLALGAWELTMNPDTNTSSSIPGCFNPQDCPAAYSPPTWISTASTGLWGSSLVGVGVFLIVIGSVRMARPPVADPEEPEDRTSP